MTDRARASKMARTRPDRLSPAADPSDARSCKPRSSPTPHRAASPRDVADCPQRARSVRGTGWGGGHNRRLGLVDEIGRQQRAHREMQHAHHLERGGQHAGADGIHARDLVARVATEQARAASSSLAGQGRGGEGSRRTAARCLRRHPTERPPVPNPTYIKSLKVGANDVGRKSLTLSSPTANLGGRSRRLSRDSVHERPTRTDTAATA